MTFIFLVFLSALSIELMGTYISVVGLAAAFASDPIIMLMAVSLDFAKIMLVSVSYKHWNRLSGLLRFYVIPAVAILMTISSAGVAGYLSQSFQKAVLPNKDVTIKLEALESEKTRLEQRKIDIDKQISQLPPSMVRGRRQLIDSFKPEEESIRKRLSELETQVTDIKSKNVEVQAHIGPIAFISEAFGVTMETAVKYVIALIVFVFDPLAVVLLIIGNFLLELRRKEEKEKKNENIPVHSGSLVHDIDGSTTDSVHDSHNHVDDSIPVDDNSVNSDVLPVALHVEEPQETCAEILPFYNSPDFAPVVPVEEPAELELVPIEEEEELKEPTPTVKSARKFKAKEDVKDLLFLLPEEQVNEEKTVEIKTPEPPKTAEFHGPPRHSELMATRIVDGAKTIFNQ
ncbi:hypothetical protein RsoM2USA_214 [Ralstonia phage RsoM2USA]|nr:hypothetical protein RsoM2USA_214 [Ralstonia phage RsoM2USA]